MKKETHDDIFARRLLKSKQFLDNRIGLNIFFKIGKDQFAKTLHVIGRVFHALAARDRAKNSAKFL
jgi:hypothetical protein